MMGSLTSKAPLTPTNTCANSESRRTADSGSDMKLPTEPLSLMNGEARTKPGDIRKPPELTSLEPQDLESAPKDSPSASKQAGFVTVESKSATVEHSSIIVNAEAFTKEQASTAKELASITSESGSVLCSPSDELIPKTTDQPQVKSSAVDVPKLQGLPTSGSEKASLPTPLHGQEILAFSVTTESVDSGPPPVSAPTGLTLTDKTRSPEEDSSLVRTVHQLEGDCSDCYLSYSNDRTFLP